MFPCPACGVFRSIPRAGFSWLASFSRTGERPFLSGVASLCRIKNVPEVSMPMFDKSDRTCSYSAGYPPIRRASAYPHANVEPPHQISSTLPRVIRLSSSSPIHSFDHTTCLPQPLHTAPGVFFHPFAQIFNLK